MCVGVLGEHVILHASSLENLADNYTHHLMVEEIRPIGFYAHG